MTIRRHHLNLLWIAFVAIVGMLSVAVTRRRPAPRSRRRRRAARRALAADCRLLLARPIRPPRSPGSPGPRASSGRDSAAGLDVPRSGSSCECRSNDPAAPAPKPESRSSDESRTDQGRDEVVAYLASRPAAFVAGVRLVSAEREPAEVAPLPPHAPPPHLIHSPRETFLVSHVVGVRAPGPSAGHRSGRLSADTSVTISICG